MYATPHNRTLLRAIHRPPNCRAGLLSTWHATSQKFPATLSFCASWQNCYSQPIALAAGFRKCGWPDFANAVGMARSGVPRMGKGSRCPSKPPPARKNHQTRLPRQSFQSKRYNGRISVVRRSGASPRADFAGARRQRRRSTRGRDECRCCSFWPAPALSAVSRYA